ncbi:biotin--[acetyl-CoA-carboxylase] ligase [Pseudothauera nasutitermitis]|uniref:biotin--[biotin carboxyl-carrier protein] ligase n=1 Tax=Pseudothauera nasutitermitis TaxID=2565930 RepID=A0A4S4AX13_9RHOO|nr:biotin--[acetyl-CoA-carboxylase] ligase [Pseudothauera nasutitermitis]THF63825.1 biotin--[acetyl-CoA-carboxylase] ligase [Pseudothauera nasutitermitis]
MTGSIPCPALDLERVLALLGHRAARFAPRTVEECTSTNTELVERPPIEDGRIHVLIAERQTAGRGRRGRNWHSWPGAGLTFSTLWRFAPGSAVPAGLSLAAGLALARALEKLDVAGIQLKWPNDVLVHGQKLAGILVELLPMRGRPPAAVIGIGINLRLPAHATVPDQPGGITDLAGQLASPPSREELLARVLAELHDLFEVYASAGFPALRAAWQQRNAFADLPVRISGEGVETRGTCIGVDDDGALLVRGEDGVQRILSGEVSLRVDP